MAPGSDAGAWPATSIVSPSDTCLGLTRTGRAVVVADGCPLPEPEPLVSATAEAGTASIVAAMVIWTERIVRRLDLDLKPRTS